jgi:hypothetical protein
MEPSLPFLFALGSTQLLRNFALPATTTKALSFFQVSTPVSTAHRSAMLPQETLFPTVVNAELASFGILPPSTVSLRLALLEDYSILQQRIAIFAIPFYQPPSVPSARPVALSPIPMDSPRVDIPVPVCRGMIGPPRAIPAAALPRIATVAIAS